MAVGGIPGPGPFRGFVPYDEAGAAIFFGRSAELQVLAAQVTREAARATALTGEAGVGKTSLLRAGLVPHLARQGVLGLYVGAYRTIDQELWQSASRVHAEPPASGENATDYLVRLARASSGGTLLILDHLEDLLRDPAGAPKLAELGEMLATAATAAGPRLRFLLCAERGAFHLLDRLQPTSGLSPAPQSWTELGRLGQEQAADVIEKTALQTGTFFEAGLAAAVAVDLCRRGPCLPLHLQIVARTLLDLRLTSLRRYERSGGADLLIPLFFERLVGEAGGRPARQVLMAVAASPICRAGELAVRTRLPRPVVDQILSTFVARGVLAKREADREDRFTLVHPALADAIDAFTAVDRARKQAAHRSLRRRILASERLSLREVYTVRRRLGGALSAEEESAVTRSLRRGIFQVALGALAAIALLVTVFFDLRTSYTLDLQPPGDPVGARVIVRLGRPSLSFLYFLPSHPRFGSVLADTGFSGASMAADVSQKIATGRASGSLERDRTTAVPGWMHTVIDGLRPVPRGVTLVLLGDPNGIISLKQAFADPVSRREALDALAVIGGGRAGEDEILAAALTDPSPEIRRRGVEVAAAIDRRFGKGSHGTTLRSALGDTSFDVKTAVLRECESLAPTEAAAILAVALTNRDPDLRHLAEKALLALATRAPAAAAAAARPMVRSTDAQARRTGLSLLEQIAAAAPAEASSALMDLVADEKAPEEARVAALLYLRKTGVPLSQLGPTLEKATGADASPRLRAAALPLQARLLDPVKAEELAVAEGKGPPAARAVAAAVWGAVAAHNPDRAAKALKGFVYDPAAEVRTEAARSFAALRRDGLPLAQKLLLDPNPEVQRAAIESVVQLAAVQPYPAGEALGRAFKNVRPAMRRTIVQAMAKIAVERPAAVVAPLARALKEGDSASRAAAAATFCAMAKKNAAAASPYLRIAARDDDRDVRTTAASCLSALAEGDPKSAARIAVELAAASEAPVRAAAAASLGGLAAKARELVLSPLLLLLADPDRGVRAAALEALSTVDVGETPDPAAAQADPARPRGKRADDIEKALSILLSQGDQDERRRALVVAAKNSMLGLIRQAASDADESVRLEAIRAAGTLGAPGAEILQGAVEDRSGAVRALAVRRLAETSDRAGTQVLPVLEAMLRSGDAASRRSSVAALGDLGATGDAATRILGEVLAQPGESVRAAAASALGRIALRNPAGATPLLERALFDAAHDVRAAAVAGLAGVWARERPAAELATALASAETDSPRRLVALQALVLQAHSPDKGADAARALDHVAETGPPLARLAAQIGRAFLHSKPAEMEAFLGKLFGG